MDPREQRLYQELMRLGHDRPTAIFHPEQDESQEHVVGLLRGVLSRYEMAPDVDYRIEPLREGKSADALQFTLTSAHAFEMIYELRLDMQDRLQSLDAIFEAHADESILGPGNKEPSHTEQDEEEERRAADELRFSAISHVPMQSPRISAFLRHPARWISGRKMLSRISCEP